MNRLLMSTTLLCSLAFAALAPMAARAQTRDAESTELRAFRTAIRAKYDLKETAWAAQDYQRLVTGFYAPGAFSAVEGEPEFYAQGRARFLELYKTYVADTTKIRIESVHTHVNGNMGWDWTNFHAEVKPEKVKEYPPSPVRILFVWEKIGSEWFCSGDVVLLGRFDTPVKPR